MKWVRKEIGSTTFGSIIKYEDNIYLYLNDHFIRLEDSWNFNIKTGADIGLSDNGDVFVLDMDSITAYNSTSGNGSTSVLKMFYLLTENNDIPEE